MKPFNPPPKIDFPELSQEDVAALSKKSKKHMLDKDSAVYKKYIAPAKAREKQLKKQTRNKWISENWIGLAGLLLSVIAIVISIIAMLG